MADPAANAPEEWHVPQRGAFVAAVLVPLALLLLVVAAGRLYDRDLKPSRQPTSSFPAPGIETYIHDGRGDPVRSPSHADRDPAIARAKRDVAVHGLAGWERQR